MGPLWPDGSVGRKSHALRESVISRDDGALWYSETVAPKFAEAAGTLTATTRTSLAPKLLGMIGVLLPHACDMRRTLRYWPQKSLLVDCCQFTFTEAAVPVPTTFVPLTE